MFAGVKKIINAIDINVLVNWYYSNWSRAEISDDIIGHSIKWLETQLRAKTIASPRE